MKLLLLLIPGMCHGMLYGIQRCIKYDVDSTRGNRNIKVLDRGNMVVAKVKDPKNHTLGDVKMGNLTDEGNCHYKSRFVLIDKSKTQKVVQVTTEYNNGGKQISEYIEAAPGEYTDLVRESVPLNLNDDSLPDHVHYSYDDSDDLHTIKVKDSLQQTKIGEVILNDMVIDDLPDSLERFVHVWHSDTGKKHIKIDTHMSDSRVISKSFVEDTPGSKKYVEAPSCNNYFANPFGCNVQPEM